MTVKIIGGGLAGAEAAYQLLKRGFGVELYEMRPDKSTGAHCTGGIAELVCSNSLKSELADTASGVLKAEMSAVGSLILEAAQQAKVPAGAALAVDREKFSLKVLERLKSFEGFSLIRKEITELPESNTIIATGPLTSNDFAAKLISLTGGYLHFVDAAAPIVSADSIDYERAFFGARYNKGEPDYLNCGMTKEEYTAFYEALITAECVEDKLLDAKYFEGCMPVEAMARGGADSLRYGPLRPVGISSPLGEKYYAVLQLRRENLEGDAYNLVGFQTNLTFPEQKRVFGMIPAMRNAEYLRYGVMHRNTFVNSPKILDGTFMLKDSNNIYIAGQLSGVEGYVESAMSGMIAGIALAMRLSGISPYIPDGYTVSGALARYISNPSVESFQPMNSNFGLLPPPDANIRDKKERKRYLADRAIKSMAEYAKKERGEKYGTNA